MAAPSSAVFPRPIDAVMAILNLRWWVPAVDSESRLPAAVRLLRDPLYVRGWVYFLVPALMAMAAASSPGLRGGAGLAAAVGVSIAWIAAVRARFAIAECLAARRHELTTGQDLKRAA